MGAPKKNQFWKLRSRHGREKIFQSPQSLWESACEYFEYIDKSTFKAERVFGTGKRLNENRAVPYTISGLCFFLRCDEQTLKNYGTKEEYKDFHEVVRQINQVCFTQKFSLAAAGLLNANLISRDLGLRDANDINVKYNIEKQLSEFYEDGKLNEEGLLKLAELLAEHLKTNQ